MSAKYKRIRQADEALPDPLRWLTRAFSSITLSVILLILVAIYGTLGSVPVYFMAIGGLWVASALVVLGGTGWFIARFARASQASGRAKGSVGFALALLALGFTALLCWGSIHLVDTNQFLRTHKATVIYRLPAFEMNEPEFFAAWPLQIVLMLFVVNMIWATIRRIEFSIPRLGVLTVHAGIVIMALGSVFYSQLKLEGDMFIIRGDLPGGRPISHFYDRNMPALFVSYNNTPSVEFPLPELPRYNDYAEGELDLRLHERGDYQPMFGGLRITIPGFISYGTFERVWVPVDNPSQAFQGANPAVGSAGNTPVKPQPVLTVAFGDAQRVGNGPRFTLPAERPAERVIEQPGFAVEFITQPTPQRLDALLTDLDAPHVLVVDIPGSNFKQAYAITPGMPSVTLGLTGYTMQVEEVGPYTLPFVTEGYKDATDTQATVTFTGQSKNFRRIVMHRYPERSQDFNEGQRSEPDPAFRVTYLDNTKPQVRLVRTAAGESLSVLLRLPGFAPAYGPLLDGKVPLPNGHAGGGLSWMHVVDRLDAAAPAQRPVITPKDQRDPKLEGTYEHAIVPVRLDYDPRDAADQPAGEPFSQTVWLKQMPYLEQPGGDAVPQRINIPGYGTVEVALGRQRFALPFAVAMTDFTMTPYAGSTIPRDFESQLLIYPVDAQGQPDGTPAREVTRLNNPVVYRAENAPLALGKIKLSQAGWDPGDPQTPPMAKLERDAHGRFTNQQRFTILGVGNNVGIRMIFLGGVLIFLGIPYAFYVKPWLIKRKARKFTESLPKASPPRSNPPTKLRVGKPDRTPELVTATSADESR